MTGAPRPKHPPFSHNPASVRSFDRVEMNRILASEIQSLWHSLGFTQVKVWAEEKRVRVPKYVIRNHKSEKDGDASEVVTSWEIVSNLRNGLPVLP